MVVTAGQALGIDVGGTGIKGAVVDVASGELVTERFRLDTPQPATPEAVRDTIAEVAKEIGFTGPTGLDFPSAISGGVVMTAANLDKGWIGQRIGDVINPVLPRPGFYLNDADAAALAEMRFGAGRGVPGLAIMVTFGTGIGIGLVHNGVLIPNAELGHIEIDGVDAETRAAASARKRDGISWKEWAERANRYLTTLENLLYPDLFLLGGGVTKNPEKWVPHLHTRTPLMVATLVNNAGIVGSAVAAYEAFFSSAASA